MKKFLSIIRHAARKLIRKVERLIPPSKRYIMFESELDYAESARAIYDYMIRHQMNRKYHLIWSVKDPSLYPPEKNVVFIHRDASSVRWNYYLNRCKYFIFTHPWWMTSWKKGQVVINTSHGTLPIKAGSSNPEKLFDYFLCGTDFTERYKTLYWNNEAHWYQPVPLDMPRNDWLFDRRDYLAPILNGKQYRSIILCMPTFKQSKNWSDSDEQNPYMISVVQSREDMLRLNHFLAEQNALLICKLHHLQRLDYLSTEQFSNILYLSDEQLYRHDIMINHVLTCSDALITDFSSVCFDYMLLDRQIGFFKNTVDQYKRGYLMEDPESLMAGESILDLDGMILFISHVLEARDAFRAQRNDIVQKCFRFRDANNCKRFLAYFGFLKQEK